MMEKQLDINVLFLFLQIVGVIIVLIFFWDVTKAVYAADEDASPIYYIGFWLIVVILGLSFSYRIKKYFKRKNKPF